ncbi:MAG: ribonuclease III [Sulfuricellaceae bacterium]|jgi:ribonuclease-3
MDVGGLPGGLGYAFKKPALLRQALTHRSFGASNNERLEFLGDSVLNCAIASSLFRLYPQLSEGELSRLRAHLVKEQTLAEIARRRELGKHLVLGEGEIRSGGADRPSILADTLEALIGAVFLDGGFEAAEAVVASLYSGHLDNLDPKTLGKDPKTLLQEYLQSRRLGLPQYNIVSTTGEAHKQLFQVECLIPDLAVRSLGKGHSRRSAEQDAARIAYQLANAHV